MKLVKYDKPTKTSTITLTDTELIDLHGLVSGILATSQRQDFVVLGLEKERLQKIGEELDELLDVRVAPHPTAR